MNAESENIKNKKDYTSIEEEIDAILAKNDDQNHALKRIIEECNSTRVKQTLPDEQTNKTEKKKFYNKIFKRVKQLFNR